MQENTTLSFPLSIKWRAKILDTLWALKAMAFLLSNLKPSLLPQTKSKPISQTLSSAKTTTSQTTSLFFTSCATPLSTLQTPTAQVALGSTPTTGAKDEHQQQKDEFYLNLGVAVRTLREDMPLIFVKDLNYDIYRWFSHLGILVFLLGMCDFGVIWVWFYVRFKRFHIGGYGFLMLNLIILVNEFSSSVILCRWVIFCNI